MSSDLAVFQRQRGVTLIELIVFIVIISVGLAGILAVMNATVGASANPMLRKQAVTMAEAILEEVLARAPTLTLPETDQTNCSNRLQYVGVLDFACFDGSPATAVIRGDSTLGAASVPALAALSATVAVVPVTISGVAMLRVTVSVSGGGEPIALTGYRVNLAEF